MTHRRPYSFACTPRLLAAGVALAVVLGASHAQAGFEIRGAGIPKAAPQSGGAMESDSTLAPIGMMPDASGQATIPVTAVPIDAPAPVDQAPLMAAHSGDVLDGFGDDLPMVIALQQIAPAGYQFAFAPGVEAGQRVSWQGGKHWRDVARDMLASRGLTYDIRDNVLTVMEQGGSAPMQTAQVTPAPQAPTPPDSVETAEVRRKKPGGLISRIRSQLSHEEMPVEATATPRAAADELSAQWDMAESDAQAMPSSSALARDEEFAPAPGEDLSPISLTMAQPRAQQSMSPVVRPPMSAPSMSDRPTMMAGSWQGEAGMTLRDVMQEWANRAGVELYWSIDYDYRLRQDVSIQGTFADATAQLLDRFAKAKPRPYAQLHQQGGKPRTLVVKAYGVGY